MLGSIAKRIVTYARIGQKNKILSEVVEFIPKGNSKKLSETVYRQQFSNGKISSQIRSRSVLEDEKYGTRVIYESHSTNPNAPTKKAEITDRTSHVHQTLGYGYKNENMVRNDSFELSKDGSYIAKEEHEYIGCINAPNCYGKRTDVYLPTEHLHYINDKLYTKTAPVFYQRKPSNIKL